MNCKPPSLSRLIEEVNSSLFLRLRDLAGVQQRKNAGNDRRGDEERTTGSRMTLQTRRLLALGTNEFAGRASRGRPGMSAPAGAALSAC